MPSTAKPILKPHVKWWIDEFDACYTDGDEWDSLTERWVMRKVLIMPATHIGKLHGLIQADYSPVLTSAEVDAWLASGEEAKLERKKFPAGDY